MSKSNVVFNLGLDKINLIGKLVPKNTSYAVAIFASFALSYIVLLVVKKFCTKTQNEYIQRICKITKAKIFTNIVYIALGALLIPLIQSSFYNLQYNTVNKEVINNHAWIKRLINNVE
jgi:hypothetical protein